MSNKPSPLGPDYGTHVKNPLTRLGRWGYTKCLHCGKFYTQQGISRHWEHCRSNPKNTGERS